EGCTHGKHALLPAVFYVGEWSGSVPDRPSLRPCPRRWHHRGPTFAGFHRRQRLRVARGVPRRAPATGGEGRGCGDYGAGHPAHLEGPETLGSTEERAHDLARFWHGRDAADAGAAERS